MSLYSLYYEDVYPLKLDPAGALAGFFAGASDLVVFVVAALGGAGLLPVVLFALCLGFFLEL